MISEFIRHYGLLAVFIGVAIEGDATMLTAGVAAQLQLLALYSVIAVGVIGAWVGDTVWYVAGRFAGERFNKEAKFREASERIQRLSGKLGVYSICASRFIWGTRIMTMSFWGYNRLSFLRFAIMDLIACLFWALLLGGLGFFFSKSAEVLLGGVRRLEEWLLISVVVSIIVVAIVHLIYKRRRARAVPQKNQER